MSIQTKVENFVKETFFFPYKSVEELGVWKGIRVFAPVLHRLAFIGTHLVLADGEDIRWATPDETEEYIRYIHPDN